MKHSIGRQLAGGLAFACFALAFDARAEEVAAAQLEWGAGVRGAVRLQNPNKTADAAGNDHTKLNDQYMDELTLELRSNGRVTPLLGWTATIAADGRTRAEQAAGAPLAFQLQPLDVIAQLDFTDELHVWLGRMLTPVDRANFSGPWFNPAWTYPGVLDGYFGPRGTEEAGREVGVTLWGDVGAGKLKYYAALLDLDGGYGLSRGYAGQNPLLSFRVAYAFLGKEPGFYNASSYYGGQDILALGAGFQFQKGYRCQQGTWNCGAIDGKDDLIEQNADLLAEKRLGAVTPGLELGYHHESGQTRSFNHALSVLPSLTSGVGPVPGKLSANMRFQLVTSGADETAATHTLIEPSVAYLFKDWFGKLQLSYSRGTTSPRTGATRHYQFLQLGLQVQQ